MTPLPHPITYDSKKDDPLPDVRFVICENCGSEGRIIHTRMFNGEPIDVDCGECPVCFGTGYEEVEAEPVTLEDLEKVT